MKPLMTFAAISAVSFAFLTSQLATSSEAHACGDYGALYTELTSADVTLATNLLEKQVSDRLSRMRAPLTERRLFSRAAPRPLTTNSVVVLSYQAPRPGDRVFAEAKVVHGKLTIAAPNVARLILPYRVDLAAKSVELLQGETWVPAAKWKRAPQKIAKSTALR